MFKPTTEEDSEDTSPYDIYGASTIYLVRPANNDHEEAGFVSRLV